MTETQKPILLVGMMGAGKTALGCALADRLELPFADTDKEVEKISGKTIPEIFEIHGEEAFRALERGVVQGLLARGRGVIAGGGGVMPDPQARTIWLKGDAKSLYERIRGGKDRPLLKDIETYKTLYDKRKPDYAKAEIHIDTASHNLDEALSIVLKALS